jgi:hypothetical protein
VHTAELVNMQVVPPPPADRNVAARRAASMNSGGGTLHPPVDGDVINGDTALG